METYLGQTCKVRVVSYCVCGSKLVHMLAEWPAALPEWPAVLPEWPAALSE